MADDFVPILDLDQGQALAPVRLSLPSAGVVTYPPRSTFGPRAQPDYQLVLVHTGSARVAVDGVARDIPPGHVGLLLPGATEFFTWAHDRETHHGWIALPPTSLDHATREALAAAPRCLPLSRSLTSCVEIGDATAAVDGPGRPVLEAIGRAAFALYLAESAHADLASSPEHPAVGRARVIARQRACEGLGVGDLAREVGVSAEHLVRLFRRDLGITPGAYLRRERLARAVHLLTHTGLSVAEVAHRAGFATPHHLAASLRAATGQTPTELRRRSWTARSSQ